MQPHSTCLLKELFRQTFFTFLGARTRVIPTYHGVKSEHTGGEEEPNHCSVCDQQFQPQAGMDRLSTCRLGGSAGPGASLLFVAPLQEGCQIVGAEGGGCQRGRGEAADSTTSASRARPQCLHSVIECAYSCVFV